MMDLKAGAQYLGCTLHAVRGLIWKGEIPFVRLGKKFVVDANDLERWIEAHKERNQDF